MGRHDRLRRHRYARGRALLLPFVGRRDGKNFVYSHEQIMQKYQKNIKMVDRIPDALSGAMGNQMYVATFSTREEMEQFYSDVLAVTDGDAAAAQAALSGAGSGRAHQGSDPEAQPQPGGQAHHCCDKDPHPRRHQDQPQGPEVISTKLYKPQLQREMNDSAAVF